jgi:hypothetical protein
MVKQIRSKAGGIKMNDNQRIANNAVNPVIITENKKSLQQSTKMLIRVGNEIGLNIGEKNTKYYSEISSR